MENERKFILYKHTSPDGKSYIGITTQRLEKRSGNDGCKYRGNEIFWQDIQKFGWENFSHEILWPELNEETARHLEKVFIKHYQTNNPEFGYNGSIGGENPSMLNRHHTNETCQHMSETRRGENNPFFGKRHKDETRNLLSIQHQGKPLSEEHKQNIGKGLKGKMSGEKNPMYGKQRSYEAKISCKVNNLYSVNFNTNSKNWQRKHSRLLIEYKNISL